MRIKITKPGIYGANGVEIAVGTELDLKTEPTGWAGRYETISSDSAEKTPVLNEADIDAMTVDQLKEYLATKDVTLKGDEKKPDLVTLAKAAL
jgi:hypothetical protein